MGGTGSPETMPKKDSKRRGGGGAVGVTPELPTLICT